MSVNYEYVIEIGVGVVLIVASFAAKGFSYGMPPHGKKPKYPASRRIRVVLLSVGLISLAMGVLGAMRR
jgi:hypothetical protein